MTIGAIILYAIHNGDPLETPAKEQSK